MAKNLKLNIKNIQIAKALDLGELKSKLAKKKEPATPSGKGHAPKAKAKAKPVAEETEIKQPEAPPRVRARSKSVFAAETPEEKVAETPLEAPVEQESVTQIEKSTPPTAKEFKSRVGRKKAVEKEALPVEVTPSVEGIEKEEPISVKEEAEEFKIEPRKIEPHPDIQQAPVARSELTQSQEKLGPTGKHIKDLLPTKPTVKGQETTPRYKEEHPQPAVAETTHGAGFSIEEEAPVRKGGKGLAFKEFRDVKPAKRQEERVFDARDRHGLRDTEEEHRWRKKRVAKRQQHEEIPVVRPTALKIRTPISIKDLAAEMKLKASQLISKLFMQGVIVTLNDMLDDETTLQLLGHEFGCAIEIDTSEAQRIRITDKNVEEEIKATTAEELIIRPPVIAFMGHVDHGKTSLIDAIRKSNRAAGEAGAITQHIGAFRSHTPVGDITILDTPGHEAFSAMRARGADVTDIVVLVVAGDEGIQQQTVEAIEHAKAAHVTIVVALNKSDKPGFNPEKVYKQMADHELLPEAWGGQTLTVNCSAVTGAGIKDLLENLALQAEVLELKANPKERARGTVLESEMHKGMGAVATVLVQNGTLRLGDSLVFEQLWGRIKTMRDEYGRDLTEAAPSTPVAITGLSGLPEAGQEFIVVKSERDAREIAEARRLGMRQTLLQQKKTVTAENLLQQATPSSKKVLNVILRADVQGSLEALRVALQKIESTKAELNIIFAGVGEISESDIQLATTSKAVVIGFHTRIESHADSLIKQYGVQVRLHDIIYHAIDDVKVLMTNLLDKLAQETIKGKAEVRALFKSSQAGVIAGCIVIDGTIHRSNQIRILRGEEEIGKSQISSLRKVKEDAREVHKGQECGIALVRFTDVAVGDILEASEITYISQEL